MSTLVNVKDLAVSYFTYAGEVQSVRRREELIQDAREKGALIDASYGRRTQAVLIMDSDHVILSGIALDSVTGRFVQAEEKNEKGK